VAPAGVEKPPGPVHQRHRSWATGHPWTHNEDGPRRLLVPHRKARANAGQDKPGLSQGPFAKPAPGVAALMAANQAAEPLRVNANTATLPELLGAEAKPDANPLIHRRPT
jgi:hypothetical protein